MPLAALLHACDYVPRLFHRCGEVGVLFRQILTLDKGLPPFVDGRLVINCVCDQRGDDLLDHVDQPGPDPRGGTSGTGRFPRGRTSGTGRLSTCFGQQLRQCLLCEHGLKIAAATPIP